MSSHCSTIKTNADKHWPYDEYYTGEKDGEDRKGGDGEHHWTGAKILHACQWSSKDAKDLVLEKIEPEELKDLAIVLRPAACLTSTLFGNSIEWYTGSFLRDTMHGLGDYRWRYTGHSGIHTTYEGYFYSNDMHGYGTMSYPDGMVFTGLYSNNSRYGPGVDTDFVYEDVGLWRGVQLMRLAWRPSCGSIIPDLSQGELGRKYVAPHRVLLQTDSVVIGEINSALDILKQNGCDPQRAVDNWMKLYPKHCTDQASKLCHIKDFQRDYYKGNIQELKVIDALPPPDEHSSLDQSALFDNNANNPGYYYAWNNDDLMIDIMKHCYKHENQRKCQEMSSVDIFSMMSGQRKAFKRPGKYEIDCRTLLMASYLGDVHNVTILINDEDVNPGVTDNKGNSALMYATCGDHTDLIHFMVEAGANVDSFNDSCCTALGLAILRFLYSQKDITPSQMIQALTPPPSPPSPPQPIQVLDQVEEWNMSREVVSTTASVPIASNKLLKGAKKSAQSLKEPPKKNNENQSKLPDIPEAVSSESISEIKNLYNIIQLEYMSRINDLFGLPSATTTVPYIFEVNDMTIGMDLFIDDDPKKVSDKNTKKIVSNIIKQTTKPSKEAMWLSSDKDIVSMNSAEKLKMDLLSKIMFTILQLLSVGASPNLVKCPQPALVMAVFAGCPDLVLQLVLHGADVNEKYPEMLGYTPLDLAISQPMSTNNLNLVRTLLECGSDPNHRLRFVEHDQEVPGPTLLHVLLTRKIDTEAESELQHQLLELLLQYKCDPMVQFKGHSAVDIALSKEANILDVFIENPTTNLNAVINHSSQTILVKMFSWAFFKTANSMDRLQIITNLLLYGADPLIECQNDLEVYNNIFCFMKKTIFDVENPHGKTNPAGSSKSIANVKGKKSIEKIKEKPKEKGKLSEKSSTRTAFSEIADYKQAQELMMDCARMLIVRWLQAKLMKELVSIIDRFQHRQWNMILKEHKDKKPVGLWLTAERCLEIWDILKTTRNKMYKNNRNLKHLLCIVMFYNKKYSDGEIKEKTPNAPIKNAIDSDVAALLRDYKAGNMLSDDMMELKRPYVKPELTSKNEKFDVCFECMLPNEDETIICQSCKQVVFCSWDCMRENVQRPHCHPCSEYLKEMYFPPGSSDASIPTSK